MLREARELQDAAVRQLMARAAITSSTVNTWQPDRSAREKGIDTALGSVIGEEDSRAKREPDEMI